MAGGAQCTPLAVAVASGPVPCSEWPNGPNVLLVEWPKTSGQRRGRQVAKPDLHSAPASAMGLSENKRKTRIGDDPRNTRWSNDTSSPGFRLLASMGWTPGQSALQAQKGAPPKKVVAVPTAKGDLKGIGATPAALGSGPGRIQFVSAGTLDQQQQPSSLGAQAAASAGHMPYALRRPELQSSDYGALLAKLNQNASGSVVRSRARHLSSKRQAVSRADALSEILGGTPMPFPAKRSAVGASEEDHSEQHEAEEHHEKKKRKTEERQNDRTQKLSKEEKKRLKRDAKDAEKEKNKDKVKDKDKDKDKALKREQKKRHKEPRKIEKKSKATKDKVSDDKGSSDNGLRESKRKDEKSQKKNLEKTRKEVDASDDKKDKKRHEASEKVSKSREDGRNKKERRKSSSKSSHH